MTNINNTPPRFLPAPDSARVCAQPGIRLVGRFAPGPRGIGCVFGQAAGMTVVSPLYSVLGTVVGFVGL